MRQEAGPKGKGSLAWLANRSQAALDRAREMFEAAATQAVQRTSNFKPFTFNGPVTVKIVFIDPSFADTVEQLDFVTRVNGTTIRFVRSGFPQGL
jgi:D-aminopeptidase